MLDFTTLSDEVFELLQIPHQDRTIEKLQSLKRSCNFLISNWMNEYNLLWTSVNYFYNLTTGSIDITFDENLSDLNQVLFRKNTNNSDTQNKVVTNEGEQTVTTITFENSKAEATGVNFTQLGLKFSTDLDSQPINIRLYDNEGDFDANLDLSELTHRAGELYWLSDNIGIRGALFAFPDNSEKKSCYKIEVRAPQECTVTELVVTESYYDINLTPVERRTYLSYPNKATQGRPIIYYFDRQINPILSLYPATSPDNAGENGYLVVSYVKKIPDITTWLSEVEIPDRYYLAFVQGAAYHLSTKFKKENSEVLYNTYITNFRKAYEADNINTDFSLQIRF